MRKFLTNYIEDSIFIHCDMWGERFPMKDSVRVLDFDLAEATAINAVAGMYINGKTIYVYGVAGFMIHQMEQIKYSIGINQILYQHITQNDKKMFSRE